MKILLILFITFLSQISYSQNQITKSPLSISGYLETYYQFDLNRPSDHVRPDFIYSHNRHNEINLNLGLIKANYATDEVRANFALATGTYMNANYVAEAGVLKNIFEANTGIKLSKTKNLWFDAGIFSSHLGFEGALSKDCWTLTRSILADNSPYFESGAKITYTSDNEKLLISGLALNGWQRITRVNGNSLISFGTQLQYKITENILFNYSSFIGTDKPDSARLDRIFHNFYSIISLTNKLGITLGFDIGTEEKATDLNEVNTWYSPVAIIKYKFSDKWTIAARGEYYQDKNGVIIAIGTTNGFQTSGFSFNVDYIPASNVLIRLEGRTLNSKDKIFIKNNKEINSNSFVTGSMAYSF